ncbi:Androglobin [Schistosoma japonicum]|nr:Androglobin [Schistosoma japonicum]KAH8862581.1 Androglobin [Schistosoma japonicum]
MRFNVPVVYDPEFVNHIDLLYCNEHLFKIEILRWIICEIQNLWLSCRISVPISTSSINNNPIELNESNLPAMNSLNITSTYTYEWKPWEHIYAMTKITKDNNINTPQYNPYGKYIVKLYWMGCWRKIIVDDSIPFDEDDKPLLPQSRQSYELWPMLLTKALLKIASVE